MPPRNNVDNRQMGTKRNKERHNEKEKARERASERERERERGLVDIREKRECKVERKAPVTDRREKGNGEKERRPVRNPNDYNGPNASNVTSKFITWRTDARRKFCCSIDPLINGVI